MIYEQHNHDIQRKTIFVIIMAIIAVYGQVVTHDFILYDDPGYILENKVVLNGLHSVNIAWAFSTLYMANWHPLTWLSYMLDIQLFGLNPGAMLLENVVLHAINAIMLLLLMQRITGFFWKSTVVAALFALHPLHVESVAWISERKDVLSTLFLLLTLYFYVGYVERSNFQYYLLALGSFFLGLMAKPMLVSLPIIMLMIDYCFFGGNNVICCNSHGKKPFSASKLFAGKIPFIVLAIASCAVTLFAQDSSISSFSTYPPWLRASNALNAYIFYIAKMFWPVDLSPFYPFRETIPVWQPFFSTIILSTITILAFHTRKQYPYILFGWLWYLFTLLPVIGIVKVGLHGMADRYTYIPLIGIFIILVWGITDLLQIYSEKKNILIGVTFLVLLLCSIMSWRQVSYWKDSSTLFTHAQKVTKNNYIASHILAVDRMRKGHLNEALELLDQSIGQADWYYKPVQQKSNLLVELKRHEEAIAVLNKAILLYPTNFSAYLDLGNLYSHLGKNEEAVSCFYRWTKIDPDSAYALYNYGLSLHNNGKYTDAIEQYNKSIALNNNLPDTHNNLGITLAELGRVDEAIEQFRAALKLKPDSEDVKLNLQQANSMKSVGN